MVKTVKIGKNLVGLATFLLAVGVLSAPALAAVSGTYSVAGTGLDYKSGVKLTKQNETVFGGKVPQQSDKAPYHGTLGRSSR